MVSRAVRLCGTEQLDPPVRILTAGLLSAELDNGALRYIRFGAIEVLRGIAFLLRDENWGTLSPKIEDLRLDEHASGFSVSYTATCSDAARTLVYQASISGRADGSLSFDVIADPKTDVLTNRTGFIVLHPIDGVAGHPVKILHVDDSEETSTFPRTINPRCPFRDIRALSHEIAPGVWAKCTMEGDAFEMEDQRNWSDASYKTYVRPLTKPWPYTLPKGEKVVQSVRLEITGAVPAAAGRGEGAGASVTIGKQRGRFPAIGLGAPAAETAHALKLGALVKRIGAQWLVCEVDLRQGHGRAELEGYRKLAELTGADVTLEIITRGSMDPDSELAALARAAAEAGLSPATVSVFPAQDMVSVQPDAPWPQMPSFAETYAAARKAFPGVRLGGGMAVYFTELNRKRPPAGPLDYVTYTTCPSVHAADDRAVMETNEALPYQTISTRAFMGDAIGLRIGPSQLGCRENAYGKATTPNPRGDARVCLSIVDPRQRGLFNAAWMLTYAAACARDGLEALAFGAPTGPFGQIYRKLDFPQPYFDDLGAQAIYPGFHVVSGLARSAGAEILDTTVPQGGAVTALALRNDGRTTLWLANQGDEPVTVRLPAGSGRVAVLDAGNFEKHTRAPDFLDASAAPLGADSVVLDAYAVARVDVS
jgi:hypothetical protein